MGEEGRGMGMEPNNMAVGKPESLPFYKSFNPL
jgi:hypothetical protein